MLWSDPGWVSNLQQAQYESISEPKKPSFSAGNRLRNFFQTDFYVGDHSISSFSKVTLLKGLNWSTANCVHVTTTLVTSCFAAQLYLSASSLHCIIKWRGLGDLISILSLLEKSGTIPWLDNNNGTL